MSYEIPQKLQYQEEIFFGLTLKQTIYLVVCLFVGLLLYTKLPFHQYVNAGVAITVAILLGVVLFLNVFQKLSVHLEFRKLRVATLGNTFMMKRFLQLLAVAKGFYEIPVGKKRKYVAVLKVEPLNFKIKAKEDRDVIIFSFQKFLNALDFPVQFCMYTDELNLDEYIKEVSEKVSKSSNKKYAELFKAHKEYLDEKMREKLSVNRKFFLVIPQSDMGLEAQLKIIDELLKGMSLQSTRLYGRQLIGLLIRFFNNSHSRTELLKKDKTIYNIISPELVVNYSDRLRINNQYHRIICASGYPRTVEQGFLDKIITSTGNFDLSLHVEPFPIDQTMMMLNRELQKQRADLYAAEKKMKFKPSLEIQYQDTRGVLDSIQKGNEKLFNVSLYINIKARTRKELNILTRQVQSKLNSILVTPTIPYKKMHKGLLSVLPFGINALDVKRNITTHALSAFFPFTSPFLILERGGVFLGLNKNKLPIIKDVFKLTNANGAILATSGAGKSFTAKLIISRYLLNGTKVIVIDPQNEYSALTTSFGGSVIEISRESPTIINPLDLMGHTYAEKRLALIDMFKVMFGDLSEIQKAIIDRAISETYTAKGISQDSYSNKVPPILGDLYNKLVAMSKKSSVYERTTYNALTNRLAMYVDGVFSFLNQETKIDVNNNFVTFTIGDMPKQVKPVMMFLILEYVYSNMKKDRSRKLLVVDEAWSMLQNAGEEGYIFEVVKTCRKFNLGLLLITQDVADLVGSKAGRAVLANSSYTILLRQKSAIIDSVQSVFNLSNTERERLLTANAGEGVIIMENDHQELQVIASDEEHKIITTNADELKKKEGILKEPVAQENITVSLDTDKGFYKKSTLSPEQIHFLQSKHYIESKHVSLYNRNYAIYLVRRNGWHSPAHTFLIHAIKEALLEYTNQVHSDENSRSDSITPDITFKDPQGSEWALEIETGSNLRHHKRYLCGKVEGLNKKYGNRWRWVVTETELRSKYQTTFGIDTLIRENIPLFIKHLFPKKNIIMGKKTVPAIFTTRDENSKGQFRKTRDSLEDQKTNCPLEEKP